LHEKATSRSNWQSAQRNRAKPPASHASVQTTLNIYTHVVDGSHR
jgi:hypothetical protein